MGTGSAAMRWGWFVVAALRYFVRQMVVLVLLLGIFFSALYAWVIDWLGVRTAVATWFAELITAPLMP